MTIKQASLRFALWVMFLVISPRVQATVFPVPSDGSIVGEVQQVSVYSNDSAVSLAARYSLGLNSLIVANPGLKENTILSSGTIILATAFILPPTEHRGIVINLPEMRLYYYPPDSNSVMTFPVGIGRIGKTIPIVNGSVTRKVVNPVWIPPDDIREYNRQKGIELPYQMEAGPDNPLGPYAIYMSIPTFLIHSTIFPESIGTRASFGCIRMHEEDIKEFFPLVSAGTPVYIVDMPTKVAWFNNRLYLQSYPPLVERRGMASAQVSTVVQRIESMLPQGDLAVVNWQLVSYLVKKPDGLPHEIGYRAK